MFYFVSHGVQKQKNTSLFCHGLVRQKDFNITGSL